MYCICEIFYVLNIAVLVNFVDSMTYRCITNAKLHSYSLECVGPLNSEVVESTAFSSDFQASNVLIITPIKKYNAWLAEKYKTTGQGFTIKVDDCARMIAGAQIKNIGTRV